MASFAKATVAGNVTSDLEVRFIASGKAVLSFSVAVNERKKVNEEWVDEVSYFDIVMWDKAAEHFAENCGKGTPVTIFGRLKQETWEKDGQKRSRVVLVSENAQYPYVKGESSSNGDRADSRTSNSRAGSSSGNGRGSSGSYSGSRSSNSNSNVYDEIPF